VVVLDRIKNGLEIRGLLGHTAVVEHILVRIHTHRFTLGHLDRQSVTENK
jgi:hypothetical protein